MFFRVPPISPISVVHEAHPVSTATVVFLNGSPQSGLLLESQT